LIHQSLKKHITPLTLQLKWIDSTKTGGNSY